LECGAFGPSGNELTVTEFCPRRVITSSSKGGHYVLVLHDLDRGTSEVVFEREGDQMFAVSWSRDDVVLAIVYPLGERPQIWAIPLAPGSSHRVVVKGPPLLWAPMSSPDGRWIAFTSDESGDDEVYVIPASGEGMRSRVSSEGGRFPRWSRDGKEFFFANGSTLMTVSVSTGQGVALGQPRQLFQADNLFPAIAAPMYDVSPDGQRFITIATVAQGVEEAPPKIRVVQNWYEEFRNREQ
jgi:Tol biopolymer transport system component